MNKEMLTIREAAAAMSLGRTTLFGLIRRGELPVVRVGRATRVPRSALAEWIARNTTTGAA